MLAPAAGRGNLGCMTTTVGAIYENGVLRLAFPLPLPERSPVTVTIQTQASDPEREAWLRTNREKLATAWDDADDVFNELLEK